MRHGAVAVDARGKSSHSPRKIPGDWHRGSSPLNTTSQPFPAWYPQLCHRRPHVIILFNVLTLMGDRYSKLHLGSFMFLFSSFQFTVLRLWTYAVQKTDEVRPPILKSISPSIAVNHLHLQNTGVQNLTWAPNCIVSVPGLLVTRG